MTPADDPPPLPPIFLAWLVMAAILILSFTAYQLFK